MYTVESVTSTTSMTSMTSIQENKNVEKISMAKPTEARGGHILISFHFSLFHFCFSLFDFHLAI